MFFFLLKLVLLLFIYQFRTEARWHIGMSSVAYTRTAAVRVSNPGKGCYINYFASKVLYKLFHSVLDQIISRWITAHYSIRRKTARTLLIKDYANSLTNKRNGQNKLVVHTRGSVGHYIWFVKGSYNTSHHNLLDYLCPQPPGRSRGSRPN